MNPAGARLHPSARWISREFAELLREAGRCGKDPAGATRPFDYLIVGSGYGAAVCAAELARDGKHGVCVLERGREYLPGSFPARMADLPRRLRGRAGGFSRGGEALYDIRAGADVSVVLANGLGGGSLINAGVMRRAAASVFDERWPRGLRSVAGAHPLASLYDTLEEDLGAVIGGKENTVALHATPDLRKRAVLDRLAAGDGLVAKDAALTVAMTDGHVTSGGVQLHACKLCGDCAMGCNYGAKESLDTNLLVSAFRAGAEIYCGATVLRLQRLGDCWGVLATHTEELLRRREGGPRWIAARHVILAAGSLGSTEILMRTQRETPSLRFSPRLGERFSANGDMAVVGYNYDGAKAEAGARADEDVPPDDRLVGPTITGLIEDKVEVNGQRLLIQEMSVAGPLRRLFDEGVTTADLLHGMGQPEDSVHQAGWPVNDPFAVHESKLRYTSAFAVMADDGARGALKLGADGGDWGSDGHVTVSWPGAGDLEVFDRQVKRIDELAGKSSLRGSGRTMANPLWRLLPKELAALLKVPSGPVLTVHPLGGCAMGECVEEGVVDEYGRVFDASAQPNAIPFHPGLHVLDGSIVPTALAANPALTIAALALRGARNIRGQGAGPAPAPDRRQGERRPHVADIDAEVRARPRAETTIGVTERLSGRMELRLADGREQDCWVEVTLTYAPLPVHHLYRPDPRTGALSNAELTTAGPGGEGTLRLFRYEDWLEARRQQGIERQVFEQRNARSYHLGGTLRVLQRASTGPWRRKYAALKAWWWNRGWRDAGDGGSGQGAAGLRSLLAFASRAGEIRTFEYVLGIGAEKPAEPHEAGPAPHAPRLAPGDGALLGHKQITYRRPGNPWRQLQEMTVTAFPGLGGTRRTLRLDPRYFASRGRPLLGIERQRDHVEALADLASLAAYVARLLVSIHFWSARKPDPPEDRVVRRLPGAVRALQEPEIHWLDVDTVDGQPVQVRLARYRGRSDVHWHEPPVLFIHGYSASGTTYVHPELQPGLGEYVARNGAREAWVLDMRSSCGLPTGTWPWTMERVALMDIPAAVDFVCRCTGAPQVDVVAHCMGAVMLSMAVLTAGKDAPGDSIWGPDDAGAVDRFRGERALLGERIRRVVLSQNGPAMVMTDPNIFRTYVLSFFEEVLRPQTYRFRPEPDDGAAWELLDRVFATLPYEDEELLLENCPPLQRRNLSHLGTRHRMDALYGRTFQLAGLSDGVLRSIDDFFGPLSLNTLGQVLHFGRMQVLANRIGRNRFLNLLTLRAAWPFRTLVLHGRDNGMADVATLYRIHELLDKARCDVRILEIEGFGHQDCLIGKDAPRKIFPAILEFLDAP